MEPGPGQESVWDYPRPPKLEPVSDRIRVLFGGQQIANSKSAFRVLETSHPPTYYIPPADVGSGVLRPNALRSMCEWKGQSRYFDVVVNGAVAEQAAWCYPKPVRAFAEIKDHVAFYAHHMQECWVGDKRVQPQVGDFYGGWITSNIVGPFKGPPGTRFW